MVEAEPGGGGLLAALRRPSRLFARAAGLLVLFSAALISVDVIIRFLFGSVLLESFEISCYIFAIAVAFSLAYAAVERAHIRIDVVNARLRPAGQGIFNLMAAWFLAGTAVLLAWRGVQVFQTSFQIGARSRSVLAAPLALPQGLWSLGLLWFGVVAVALAVLATWWTFQRRWQTINATLGPPAVENEIEAEGVKTPAALPESSP